MKIIVMGTGPFAAPTFNALLQRDHEIALLVTQPIRSKRKASPNLMREIADQHEIEIYDPPSINTPEAEKYLSGFAADLFFVCDYGQILKPEILATARLGGINLHASLLPKYRGAAPINWAIYNGDQETGVTVIHMTPKIDAGPYIAQEKTAIDPDETAIGLEERLSQIGAESVCEVIEQFGETVPEAIIQNSTLVTKAPRLKKTDGLIDWNRTASEIINHIRAMQPWPRTYTYWHRKSGDPMRLNLKQAEKVESPSSTSILPGTVIQAADGQLIIATANGALQISEIQPAGKRLLATAEFLRGYPVQAGELFGPAELGN